MARRTSRGFTLVELLVVITIIGILMALLLPAVNFAVENARQRQCMNNMRQMAMGCVSFDQTKQRFPGYTNKQAYKDGNTTKYRQVSWFIEISRELERGDIYEAWQASNAATPAAPYIDFAICPSDPPDSNDQPFLAYVGNAGFNDATNNQIANGIMHNYYPDSSNATVFPTRAITATQIKDGVTNTLLISENIQATRYDVADKTSNVFVWWESSASPRGINNDKNIASVASADASKYARPSSNHPGGVNVAFADSHTQWLRQDIDYKVYVQLMTTKHSESLVQTSGTVPADWKTYLLNEKDYK